MYCCVRTGRSQCRVLNIRTLYYSHCAIPKVTVSRITIIRHIRHLALFTRVLYPHAIPKTITIGSWQIAGKRVRRRWSALTGTTVHLPRTLQPISTPCTRVKGRWLISWVFFFFLFSSSARTLCHYIIRLPVTAITVITPPRPLIRPRGVPYLRLVRPVLIRNLLHEIRIINENIVKYRCRFM